MSVTLKPFDNEAFCLSGKWLHDDYIKKMICAPEISEETRLKWFSNLPQRTDYKIWCVVNDGKPIGICGIKDINGKAGEYFGYLGSKEYRGKGNGEAMLLATIQEAKLQLELNLLRLKVIHENIPAYSLYKKVGFEIYDSDNEFIYMKMSI